MRVIWVPPQRPNGVLTGYRVLSYRAQAPRALHGQSDLLGTDDLNATISGLQPYTTYEIKIQAFTVEGGNVGLGKNVTTEESGIERSSYCLVPRAIFYVKKPFMKKRLPCQFSLLYSWMFSILFLFNITKLTFSSFPKRTHWKHNFLSMYANELSHH